MPEYKKVTDCEKCPCLNRCYEEGGECNLGYAVSLMWRKDTSLIYCSENCQLTAITFGNEEYTRVFADVIVEPGA